MGLKTAPYRTFARATGILYTLFFTLCLHTAHLQMTESEGTCRWSGKAPGCGNGICPGTDWYAIGNSTIDEDGNECADGISNLYCCPKVRKPRPFKVRVCTGTNLRGDCADIQETETECVKLPEKVVHRAKSVSTYGGCVRLYMNFHCFGNSSVALHKGNFENHTDLSKFNFANKAGSVGPCLRNDFCSPQNACQFPVSELSLGRYRDSENKIESRDGSGGLIRAYQLGYYASRTDHISITIKSKHLDTGTQPTSESLKHVRSYGLDTDVVGMLLSARLGGNGTDHRNIFPLTSDININIQAAFKTYEDIVYDMVNELGTAYLYVDVYYSVPRVLRPTQVVFRVWDTNSTVLFQDSIGNPSFLSSCTANSSLVVPTAQSPSTSFGWLSSNCKWAKSFGEQEQVDPINACQAQVACPTDFLAIGRSNIIGAEEQPDVGAQCPTRSNLYCCHKNKKPESIHAILFACTDFQGDFLEIHENKTACRNLPFIMKKRVKSVNTLGTCVRLYAGENCWGDSIALYPGNPTNNDLSKWDFADTSESVGPCLANDFCSASGTKSESNSPSCRIRFEKMLVGCCPANTGESEENISDGSVRLYRLGRNGRTEYIDAKVELHHLHLYAVSDALSLHPKIRARGLETDVIQMVIPKSLGGKETDVRNLVPTTSDPGVQLLLKHYHDVIFNLVLEHQRIFLQVNLHYETDTDTRPAQFVFRVSDGEALFLDSLPNPLILISPENSAKTTFSSLDTNLLYYIIPSVLVLFLVIIMVPWCTFGLRKIRPLNAVHDPTLQLEQVPQPILAISAGSPPLDDRLIIPSNCVSIDRTCQLGEGEFASVYKGTFKRELVTMPVAVKIMKGTVSTSHRDEIISEMNILAGVGGHANVIRFYGAVDQDYVNQGQLVIVMEFCEKGCLQSLLVDSEKKVQKVLDNENLLIYEVEGAYVFKDLVGFSIQMAAGMEYLEAKKIIHGDLATRNLLVNESGQLKISDFGLSKQLANYDIYMKTSKGPLPWRWMSPESLKHRQFSIKSDVWSFGVTCWEIYSYASIPYAGLTWTAEFVAMLENGSYRLPKPKFASNEIYDLILMCLSVDTEERPSFVEMRTKIQAISDKNWPIK